MPLTILQYITPSRMGGAEHFFLLLIEHLEKCGHRVIVLTKRDAILRQEIEKLNCPGIELHGWHTHGKFDPPTLARLCSLIRSEKVDVINTHLTTASWQGTLAGRITGVPVSAFIHATDHKTWFQHADRLIAVSGGVRQSLLEQGVPDSKIDVLYYGIDLNRYANPLDPAAAKARLGLAPTDRTVGVAASLIPRKGHRFLLEAIKRLEPTHGPLHAIFAGEGPLEATLRAQACALGMSDRVHFLGFRKDIREVICAMDVFALPSFKEGLSIAVMEAMALERPVVVTDIAGMPEVVHDRETGLLVPPGNVDALSGALGTVFSDPALSESMSRCGRKFLEQHFDQQLCLQAMEAYLRRIAEEGASRNFRAPAPAKPIPEPSTAADAPQSAAYFDLPPATSRRQLTILQYITPSRIGGAERYFLRMVKHLSTVGHRVIIVTKRDAPLRLEIEKLMESGLKLELHAWHTHGKVDPATVHKLYSLVKAQKVDVINTHLTTASWIGSLAGKLAGVPVVARVPATDQPHFYQYANHLIAVSRGVRDHLIAKGVSGSRIAVLYNGIDVNATRAPFDARTAKQRLGLDPDLPTAGVAASLIPRKGHRFLLEAIHNHPDELGNLHLLLAGEGDQEQPLRELAAQLGLEDRVHFLGFRRDVLETLSAMDIFVLPSMKEGLSNAVMEAMALERPVIVTNIAGMPEIVRDGETGLLVPPEDVPALGEALLKLTRDPEMAQQIGKAGRRFLEQHFDQERCLNEVEEYFQRVVSDAARKH